MTDEEKKIKLMEERLRKLEMLVSKLSTRVEYFEREKQRIKTDINSLANSLRKQ
jgi:hypothetical protein